MVRCNRLLGALALGASIVMQSQTAVAGPMCAAAPPPPPPLAPDWYNAMILIDISGSMGETFTTAPVATKLQEALRRAKDHVLELQARGKPVNYALWAFDSAQPSPNYVRKVIDFPAGAGANAVLSQLGFDALGNPTPATRNPIFTPGSSTPLAAAVCHGVGWLGANFSVAGTLLTPGWQWGAMTGGRPAIIQREMYTETDALENSTPAANECAGPTSTSTDYLCYEAGTWQWKVRNKLQTGNPNNDSLGTANTGLIYNVDYLFVNAITPSMMAIPTAEAGVSSFAATNAQPTLAQVDTLFGGLAKMTRGVYRTVTVNAAGAAVARRPGDVNLNGCVDNTDYSQISTFYGKSCARGQTACINADLTGDNVVDFSDYLIWARNTGAGC